MCTTVLQDPASVDAFTAELLQILNHSGLAVMISIGHRTGLFDRMAELPPSSSAAIARTAGLNERYVREWLGAMVTGGIVEYDAALKTYHLPPERAARLTRAASPANMASMMQWIPVLGSVEDDVIRCFREGGGVPYARYRRFHETMAEESHQTTCCGMLDSILPAVPGLREKLERGIDVLDIGCGRGGAMILLAKAFPKSRFAGYDFSDEAIQSARADADRQGVSNVRFDARDAAILGEEKAFDLITAFDAIHDQVRPDAVLRNIHAALRDDGVFLMQDIRASSHLEKNVGGPISPFLYTISTMHCMTVSLAGGGAGLGTCWGAELAMEMAREAGFRSVDLKQLDHDIQNNYYICRKR